MKALEARKKLLVAESEVYRQTLRLDAQNLRLYSMRMQRKYATYAALKPVLLATLPFATSLFSRKQTESRRPRSMLSTALAGWRMYKKFQPLLASLMAQYMSSQATKTGAPENSANAEQDAPAAAI